jgi:hypothetical protein
MTWLDLAQLSGDWDLWESTRATLEANADPNPEGTDWREFATSLGLLLQDRTEEAAAIASVSSGAHAMRLAVLTGLLLRDRAQVEAALAGLTDSWTTTGPLKSGLRTIGRAGVGLMEEVSERDLDDFLAGIDQLRGSELANAWTMGVVAFIELAGADRAQVRTAIADLRAHLERVGASGCLEAVERALARSPGGTRDGGTARPSTGQAGALRSATAARAPQGAVPSEP